MTPPEQTHHRADSREEQSIYWLGEALGAVEG